MVPILPILQPDNVSEINSLGGKLSTIKKRIKHGLEF